MLARKMGQHFVVFRGVYTDIFGNYLTKNDGGGEIYLNKSVSGSKSVIKNRICKESLENKKIARITIKNPDCLLLVDLV